MCCSDIFKAPMVVSILDNIVIIWLAQRSDTASKIIQDPETTIRILTIYQIALATMSLVFGVFLFIIGSKISQQKLIFWICCKIIILLLNHILILIQIWLAWPKLEVYMFIIEYFFVIIDALNIYFGWFTWHASQLTNDQIEIVV